MWSRWGDRGTQRQLSWKSKRKCSPETWVEGVGELDAGLGVEGGNLGGEGRGYRSGAKEKNSSKVAVKEGFSGSGRKVSQE